MSNWIQRQQDAIRAMNQTVQAAQTPVVAAAPPPPPEPIVIGNLTIEPIFEEPPIVHQDYFSIEGQTAAFEAARDESAASAAHLDPPPASVPPPRPPPAPPAQETPAPPVSAKPGGLFGNSAVNSAFLKLVNDMRDNVAQGVAASTPSKPYRSTERPPLPDSVNALLMKPGAEDTSSSSSSTTTLLIAGGVAVALVLAVVALKK